MVAGRLQRDCTAERSVGGGAEATTGVVAGRLVVPAEGVVDVTLDTEEAGEVAPTAPAAGTGVT